MPDVEKKRLALLFAVVADIDTGFDLLVDDPSQCRLANPVELSPIDRLAAGAAHVEPGELGWPRQAAGMGGQNPLVAPPHRCLRSDPYLPDPQPQARLFPLWAIMATSSSERCCKQPNTGSRLARPDALLSEPLLGSRARSIEAGGMLPQCVRAGDATDGANARRARGCGQLPATQGDRRGAVRRRHRIEFGDCRFSRRARGEAGWVRRAVYDRSLARNHCRGNEERTLRQ